MGLERLHFRKVPGDAEAAGPGAHMKNHQSRRKQLSHLSVMPCDLPISPQPFLCFLGVMNTGGGVLVFIFEKREIKV